MNTKQFNKILQIVRRTGEKIAIPDSNSDKVMILMDSDEYEFLAEGSLSNEAYYDECCGSDDDFDEDFNCDCKFPCKSTSDDDYSDDCELNFDEGISFGSEPIDEPEEIEYESDILKTDEKDEKIDITPMIPIDEIINGSKIKNSTDSSPLYIEPESDQGFEPITPEKMPDFGEINIEESLDDVMDETEIEELEFKPEPIE